MVQPPALLGVADILLRKREACAVVVGGERFAGWRELKSRVRRLEEQGKAAAAASGNGRCVYGEADARFLGALLAQGVGGRSSEAAEASTTGHEYRVQEGGRGRFVAVAGSGTEAVWSAKRAAEAVLKAAALLQPGVAAGVVPVERQRLAGEADNARGEKDACAATDCLDSAPAKAAAAAEGDARLPEAKRRRMLPQYLCVRLATDGTVGVLAVKRAFEAEGVRPCVVGPGSDGGAVVECTFDGREEEFIERGLAACKGRGLCSAAEVVGAASDGQGRLAGAPASRWGGDDGGGDGTLFGPTTDGPRCLPDFLSPSEENELQECCSRECGDGGDETTISLVGDLSPAAQLLGRLGAARMREGVDEADRVGSEPTAVQVTFPRAGEEVARPTAVEGAECLFMLSMGADTVLTARRPHAGSGGGHRSSRVPLERRVCVLLQGTRWSCTFGQVGLRCAGAGEEPRQTAEDEDEEEQVKDDDVKRGDSSYAVEYESTVLVVPTGRVSPAAHWVAVFFRERDEGRAGSRVAEGEGIEGADEAQQRQRQVYQESAA